MKISSESLAPYITVLLGVLVILFFAHTAFAQATYKPIVSIPGLKNTNMTLPQYVNALYILTITVGALIGVVRIALAGVKWALSDIVTEKSEARADIQGVLLGLLILLAPYIVLSQIYPDLTKLSVLESLTKINAGAARLQQPSVTGGPVTGGYMNSDQNTSDSNVLFVFTAQLNSAYYKTKLAECTAKSGVLKIIKNNFNKEGIIISTEYECRKQ